MISKRLAGLGAACLLAAGGTIAASAVPVSAAPKADEPFLECQVATLQGTVSTFELCENASLGVHLNVAVHVSEPVSITYFCTSLTVLLPTPLSSVHAVGVNCSPISA
ncbi:hypothetical protein AB0L50_09830 [Streptomyces flaveolus]|uniref:hypothetical protein n=1 Tax=Streptomyces flaveolus TaxID=67297 RepID=UPI003424A1F7